MAFWLDAQKMVQASEEERFLIEVPPSPGKTRVTVVLSWYLYGQCSDSSGNKHPKDIFGLIIFFL